MRWSQWMVDGTATLGRPLEINCSIAIWAVASWTRGANTFRNRKNRHETLIISIFTANNKYIYCKRKGMIKQLSNAVNIDNPLFYKHKHVLHLNLFSILHLHSHTVRAEAQVWLTPHNLLASWVIQVRVQDLINYKIKRNYYYLLIVCF